MMRKFSPKLRLRVPYTAQGKNSGNCGPCSIKMVADYYKIRKFDGSEYSVPSLNRLCRVTREFGCEKSDINRVLKKLGLNRHKVTYRNLRYHLKKKRPIISLFIDEDGGGHYAVITGSDDKYIYFNDFYFGMNFKRFIEGLKKQTKYFGDWLWAIFPDDL